MTIDRIEAAAWPWVATGMAIGAGWHVAAFALSLIALGGTTARIGQEYDERAAAGRAIPRWLRAAEVVRAYMADEEPREIET